MLIQMTGSHRGSDNGFEVKVYEKDEYLIVGDDIGDTLARQFISTKRARLINQGEV